MALQVTSITSSAVLYISKHVISSGLCVGGLVLASDVMIIFTSAILTFEIIGPRRRICRDSVKFSSGYHCQAYIIVVGVGTVKKGRYIRGGFQFHRVGFM